MNPVIKNEFNKHIEIFKNSSDSLVESIEIAANLCVSGLKNGNKLVLCGNGGSAADAQHIAAEIVGRYKIKRKGLPAIALTTDTSVITSISNDFGYLHVFDRQLEALTNEGDILLAISTGGTSPNVVSAVKTAKSLRCNTIGLSGKSGGDFNELCDVNIIVPSEDTPRIQEMHIFIGHTICHLIDQAFIR